ncbi:MAG: FGGY-family carbohydrate kinase [Oscillospiraceae bacterium]|nr:FGGY-family carbohydrate kinase [Oscillospiraceae bacterium]
MRTYLGIELGSTRIKAVLIDESYAPIASGEFGWENQFENGVWTYSLDEVWRGLQASVADLIGNYQTTHQTPFPTVSGMGISAMMHGYLVFGKAGNQLVPFRTWRNTITEQAATELTDLFGFNIPQRWSIAHLYHAVLGGEAHIGEIDFVTTLAGYVHEQLTGQRVIGIGDASGIFPIDSTTNDYHDNMVAQFDTRSARHGAAFKLRNVLPKVLNAGDPAGTLTADGAKLLDPTGTLTAGIPLCPPEGDAGTGMVATNSVAARTGNVSAGTSVFAMLVLEKALSKLYPEIDMVTTPTGKPVAMVHCNNCTSDLDAWVRLFGEAMGALGMNPSATELYGALYGAALTGDKDSGGLVACNYLSGEHLTGFHEGRPLFARTPDSAFTLPNFMRTLLFSAMATLKIGMDILVDGEGVTLEKMLGHGGLFKTPVVGQTLMAGALNIPVAVMESAGEGGAWGIALLASYAVQKGADETLEAFLADRVFSGYTVTSIQPDPADVVGFASYLTRYRALLEVERAAVTYLTNYGKEG